MNEKAGFEREIECYSKEVHDEAMKRLYRGLAAVVRFLRVHGHGSCELHAVDHVLGTKIKTQLIHRIDRN